ncbi:L,D-transpeptidase family protein [Bacillus cereus group sp. FL70]|uniref:L,D-transpeptidase n=1 Tax=Bacillus cereus group sp. FL70 TaxID=3040254 RepID=UPI003399E880
MKNLYKYFFVSMVLLLGLGGIHTIKAHALADAYILIQREKHTLQYVKHNKIIKSFPVTTGKKESPTPAGNFMVVYKEKNRPFYKKNIIGGAPNNPLGSRWMGLNIDGTGGNTYGIHGTNEVGTIGMKASDGCIRMNNEDVQWLYERVTNGTKVIIQ